jgi:GntR family transcriptional regulator/MocR family aminotransferase
MGSRLTGFKLDPSHAAPLYQQLFDQIVERVRSGTYPAGYRLPPSRALAEELGAHRNTVVRTYADLEAAGFVTSRVGKGTFVTTAPADAPRPAAAASASATHRGSLPWSSLFASHAVAEPLSRPDRISRLAHRDDLVQLGSMQPPPEFLPVGLFQRCIDHVLRTLGAKALAYGPREGLPRLRALIAEDLARQGVPASAEDVLVSTGSQQSLDLIARALVKQGDRFAVDSLTYPGATNVLICAGASLVTVPGDEEGPSVSALARFGPGLKGYYATPRGHNPTGVTMSLRRREALIDWSHHYGVPIIEDDYSADLALDEEANLPAMRALDRDVIYVGSFSKRLIPALRIGFVVCPPALRSVLVSLKHTLDLGTSVLLQHGLAEFLERGYLRAHLARIMPEYRHRRDTLEAALSAHLPEGVRWRRSAGALHLWISLPPTYNPEEVADEARRRGVVVAPSTLYALEPREAPGLRVTFCSEPPERLREGARRLGRALGALAPRRPAGARDMASLGVV